MVVVADHHNAIASNAEIEFQRRDAKRQGRGEARERVFRHQATRTAMALKVERMARGGRGEPRRACAQKLCSSNCACHNPSLWQEIEARMTFIAAIRSRPAASIQAPARTRSRW